MPATVFELLTGNLPERSDRPVLFLGDTEVRYGELARRAEAMAAWLAESGIQPGDRIGISLRKSVEEVVATLAAARVGAVFVNVNYQWTPRQLAHVAADCGMRALVTDRRRLKALPDAGIFDLLAIVGAKEAEGNVTPWESWPEDARASCPLPAEDDLAALLYTSGSTGRPKGVMLSHKNIVRGAWSVSTYLENTQDDRVLGLLPMSFDYGMSQLTTMLRVGGSVVLQPVFMPAEIARNMQAREVTGLPLVPPSWVQLVRYLEESGERFPSLRYVTNTGGKIPGPILDLMPQVFPGVSIFLMYGLTEAFRSTFLPPELFDTKRGAIGKSIPGEQVFVVDEERGLCGPGQVGELVHRGDLVSQGYWGNEEATAERIRSSPHLAHLIGDEKVVFSGDRVRLDEDGILWFESRADAMIKCSGHRLSPTEVEEVLYESGLIGDAVVFGVPDDELGQVVHAAVTAPEGGELAKDDLLQHCRRSMPNYMIPRQIHGWPGPFPRTASGKFDRPLIVRTCRDASPD